VSLSCLVAFYLFRSLSLGLGSDFIGGFLDADIRNCECVREKAFVAQAACLLILITQGRTETNRKNPAELKIMSKPFA
jgi:hypothetical protein